MDRGTQSFWLLVMVLLAASVVFGFGAEGRRRQVQSSESSLATGDIVGLAEVVDGDSLVVVKGEQRVAVRLIGIKAFDPKSDPGDASRFGREAVSELTRLLKDKPIRVLLHDPPTDAHGRTLAELFVDDQDVALDMVKRGLVLVYTVYPFGSMSMYLQEQARAKADRVGLWSESDMAKRAELLSREWSRKSE
ncbi:MAG: thermonuclease family protein [Myxococcales bacterium]|nr:thermonuclease family protein [Myxococcales bacterium]